MYDADVSPHCYLSGVWCGVGEGGVYCIAVNSAVISMHGTLCTCCIINKQCVDVRAHAGIRARHKEETQTISPPVFPVIAPSPSAAPELQPREGSGANLFSSSRQPRHSEVSVPGMRTAWRSLRVGPRNVTASSVEEVQEIRCSSARSEPMHVHRLRRVFYVCMSEQRLTGASSREERSPACYCTCFA